MDSTSTRNSFVVRDDVGLQRYLNTISERQLELATEPYELTVELESRFFTPTTLSQLTQLLNQPLNKGPSATNAKWDIVKFFYFRFPRPDETHSLTDSSSYYSQDDIEMFVSALARRSFRLYLVDCPDLVECLSNIHYPDLPELSVSQRRLSAFDCAGLGGLVQKCVSLREIIIGFNIMEGTHFLGECLAKAPHLQIVVFAGRCVLRRNRPSRAELPDAMVNDYVLRQLLSPQSGLQCLILRDVDLKDHHFLRIVEMLPTSRLQELHVSRNNIRSKGIVALANQLPRIKFLKEIDLSHNPCWRSDVDYYLATLLKGMLENYSIECLEMNLRRGRRLKYCTRANRARRIISETAESIPKGLWPLILEMVGTRKWDPTECPKSRFRRYRANALYSVLQQHNPILFFTRSRPG